MELNGSLSLRDCIFTIPNVIAPEACDFIVDSLKDSPLWAPALAYSDSRQGYVQVPGTRPCHKIGITREQNNIPNGPTIDSMLFGAVSICINKYVERFPLCEVTTDIGYDILRYETGHFHSRHIDYTAKMESPRILTCSIALNDNFEGGEWKFFGDEIMTQPKGTAVVFPSDFLFPHAITKITSGIRYAMITWIK